MAKSPIIIGIFPRRSESNTRAMFTPMIDYLTKILGRPVQLHTEKNFKNFLEGVKQSRYDVVHYNQYHYVKSNSLYGYQLLMKNVEFGSDKIGPAIFVKADADINSPKDLRGKRIMFGGGKQAMITYIAGIKLLKNSGLNPQDYITSFTNNPLNACRSLLFDQADACVVGSQFTSIPNISKNVDISEIRMIAQGAPLPHLPWAVKNKLDKKVKQKLPNILIGLKDSSEGRKILRMAGLTELKTARDVEYNIHRQIISEVLGERY